MGQETVVLKNYVCVTMMNTIKFKNKKKNGIMGQDTYDAYIFQLKI